MVAQLMVEVKLVGLAKRHIREGIRGIKIPVFYLLFLQFVIYISLRTSAVKLN